MKRCRTQHIDTTHTRSANDAHSPTSHHHTTATQGDVDEIGLAQEPEWKVSLHPSSSLQPRLRTRSHALRSPNAT